MAGGQKGQDARKGNGVRGHRSPSPLCSSLEFDYVYQLFVSTRKVASEYPFCVLVYKNLIMCFSFLSPQGRLLANIHSVYSYTFSPLACSLESGSSAPNATIFFLGGSHNNHPATVHVRVWTPVGTELSTPRDGAIMARPKLAGRQRRLTGHKYLRNKLSHRDVSSCRFFL